MLSSSFNKTTWSPKKKKKTDKLTKTNKQAENITNNQGVCHIAI